MKKSDKEWKSKRFGYFVLLATWDGGGVQQVLGRYFGRTEIESVIKTSRVPAAAPVQEMDRRGREGEDPF